jgi:enamine deaminase RidA (YjgF/YER057c/UK114 family)
MAPASDGFRKTLRTGGFEDLGGYSRAVRSGNYIAVSGTAATGSGGIAISSGDVYAQTHEAFKRVWGKETRFGLVARG